MKLSDRNRGSGFLGIIAAVAMIVIVAFFVREWGQIEEQLTQVREELHGLRIWQSNLKPETAQWALEEYDSLMDRFEAEAELGQYHYWDGQLGRLAFPVLRYIANASWVEYVLPEEADIRINRMELYLEDQPDPDVLGKRELANIRAHTH